MPDKDFPGSASSNTKANVTLLGVENKMSEIQSPGRDSVDRFLAEWRVERPDLDPWPVGIFARLQRVSNLLQRRAEDWLTPLGLTWEAFSVIVTLRRSGAPYVLRPTDILHASLLSSGAVTNRIDRVEKQGLVERKPDPDDRRGTLVQLTPAGKKLADTAIERHFQTLESIFEAVNRDDCSQLADTLSKLLVALERPGGKA